jgi:hypothetical protein
MGVCKCVLGGEMIMLMREWGRKALKGKGNDQRV